MAGVLGEAVKHAVQRGAVGLARGAGGGGALRGDAGNRQCAVQVFELETQQ